MQARTAAADQSTQRKREAASLEAAHTEPLSELDVEARDRNNALLAHAKRMVRSKCR